MATHDGGLGWCGLPGHLVIAHLSENLGQWVVHGCLWAVFGSDLGLLRNL